MPDYGKAEYWDDRYTSDGTSDPFDWLFNYQDLKVILDSVLPDRNARILMVGAGNAPFSPDMNRIGGYQNICNIDLSNVAIKSQGELYPEMEWHIMDVRHMSFDDAAFPVVLDKSLVDTLMCYSNSVENTLAMVDEIDRVLAPGGRYVTFSLHPLEEVTRYFSGPGHDWVVSGFRAPSSRWDEGKNRRRAIAHSMVICDRRNADGTFNHSFPLMVPGTVSDEEYAVRKAKFDQVNFEAAVKEASYEKLRNALDMALVQIMDRQLEQARQASPKKVDSTKLVSNKADSTEQGQGHGWSAVTAASAECELMSGGEDDNAQG